MTASVEFDHVSKRFGAVTAIGDVSFTVRAGETIALLGPSGCGKTTILRMIAGFEHPDQGTIAIGGRPMAGLKPYERNVGLLFQHYALFPHMNVAENVAFGLRHRGMPARAIPGRVQEMLDLVRLPDFGGRRVDQMSGGQQQRVALARALATQPSLVLLDEPLSALDAKLRHELRAELKQVLAAVGSTAIVVTHDQEEAMSLGQRVFVMRSGVLMQIGSPDDVYWRPASRFVADFMGRANWLRGTVRIETGAASFHTAGGLRLPLDGAPAAGEGELCIRPESVGVSAPDAGPALAVPGTIIEAVPLGPVRQLVIELAGGDRVVASQSNSADRSPAPGDAVSVSIPSSACALFAAPMSAATETSASRPVLTR